MAIERKRRLGPSVLATLCALLPALHTGVAVAASCSADSGHVRNALVELYTSEGCSSCPPADRALHRLTADRPRVIPLALHVDYWDSIGWKDRFAQPPFAERQRWEVRANQHRTSFTPHFFVNGREVEDWRADLDAGLRADRRQASAQIAIAAESAGADALRVRVDGNATPVGGGHGPLALYVVVTEDGLSSQVDAGENRGARLEHDAVARNWIGPIAVEAGRALIDRVLKVPALANGNTRVVAFIQDTTSAEVLQAVDTGVCRP